jgi:hypothetical protein
MLTVGGGILVLAAATGAAWFVVLGDHGQRATPPASVGGLIVQMGHGEDTKVDATTQLRCFVDGQFVGLETLSDCARKNGVATQALDVGVDQTGALAANTPSAAPPAASQAAQAVGAAEGPAGECWRYAGGGWRKVGDGLGLSACVRMLFDGHCEQPGGADYGRWMGQTVRLVPHRVEISADNKSFRLVIQQADGGCQLPDF